MKTIDATINGPFAVCCCIGVILTCTNDYNPFQDPANTRCVVTRMSFDEGDTISLFSTETVTVMIPVAGLAESFSVSAPANRLFDLGKKRFSASDIRRLGSGPYRLYFSMHDTGVQTIELAVERSNGEVTVQTIRCRVNPLPAPANVTGSYGAPLTLSTAAVKDRDAIYLWNFGLGTVIETTRPETSVVLFSSGFDRKGELRIHDGYDTTPGVPFDCFFFDTIGPTIEFHEELYRRSGDTIITGDTTFYFTVSIRDRATGGVDSASIDGKPSDIVTNDLYTWIFFRMDTLASPRSVLLCAMDNFQDSNTTIRRLHLRYDPQMRPQSGLRISILVPPCDDVAYTAPVKKLHGEVHHVSGDPFAVRLLLTTNNNPPETLSVAGTGSAEWSARLQLDSAMNTVTVTAYDEQGDSIAGAQRRILYWPDAGAGDTEPPVIVAVTTQGRNANGFITDLTSVSLHIIAFDAGEGIEALSVNGAEFPAAASPVWDVPIELVHRRNGTAVTIGARDRKGLKKDTVVVMYTNRPPRVDRRPDPPFPLLLGTPLIDSFVVNDPDGDTVQYSLVAGDTSLHIDFRGIIRWGPDNQRAGTHRFRFRISDGYNDSMYAMEVVIVESSDFRPGVAFHTSADDFPGWLEASDTLRLQLLTVPGTGTPPLTFQAINVTGGSAAAVRGDTFHFTPLLNDTGPVGFRITVTDTFNRADTLHPSLLVVPPNRPCRLRRISGFDTTAAGIHDMHDPDDADTLTFRIDDPDIDRVERFDASVRRGGRHEGLAVDGQRSFSFVISAADKDSGVDTLTVSIADRATHRDSLRLVVYYGTAPAVPALQYPLSGMVIIDSAVHFSWTGGDPDGEVRYTLRSGLCPGPLAVTAGPLTDSSTGPLPLKKSGNYCWQVIAADGKVQTPSAVGTFTFRSSNHVAFATTEMEIHRACEAPRDSFAVVLTLVKATGVAPFTFTAAMAGSGRTIPCAEGVLRYLPLVADTGLQRLVITVIDSAGNGDTLMPELFITPPNRPCSLDVIYHGQPWPDSVIDMSAAATPDTVVFRIIDPDTSLTEHHTVTIRQLNTESVGVIDTDRLISIVLDPRKAGGERDTVQVRVEDRAGYTASQQRIIYYGKK